MENEKFLNYSKASKLRQASIDPAVRRTRMIAAAKKRWENKTQEQRREHSLKMIEARKIKYGV